MVLISHGKLQLYTAKSQYWLHKAGASPEHWQFKKRKESPPIENDNNIAQNNPYFEELDIPTGSNHSGSLLSLLISIQILTQNITVHTG